MSCELWISHNKIVQIVRVLPLPFLSGALYQDVVQWKRFLSCSSQPIDLFIPI